MLNNKFSCYSNVFQAVCSVTPNSVSPGISRYTAKLLKISKIYASLTKLHPKSVFEMRKKNEVRKIIIVFPLSCESKMLRISESTRYFPRILRSSCQEKLHVTIKIAPELEQTCVWLHSDFQSSDMKLIFCDSFIIFINNIGAYKYFFY